jgi:hypothetical protein
MNTAIQSAIIAGIGVSFLAFSGRRVFLAARSWSWPQVEGTVVNSYVMTTSANLAAGRGSGHISFLEVVYKYTVAGQTYKSKRWGFDERRPKYGSRSPISGKLMWHESDLLAAYPEGAPIRVYYDPAKPASSAITRTLGLITYLWLVLGMSLALLGGVQLVNFAWK